MKQLAVSIFEATNNFCVVYLKEGVVRKSVVDYGNPNLNNSYDDFSKIALDFALEKKWKGQQHLSKYQPYFCTLDQKWIDRAARDSIRAKKSKPELLKPLLSSHLSLDNSFSGYSNFHRVNILLFLISVNLTTLKALEYSHTNKPDDDGDLPGSDRVLQLISTLIRSGQQRLFAVGINSRGYVSQVESIDFEKKLSDEVAAFLKHLINHSISERERKILFEEQIDPKNEDKKKKAVLEGLQVLEDMIKKKIDQRNQSTIYQKAVSIGTIKFEFKTRTADYSIEKEGSLFAMQLISSIKCLICRNPSNWTCIEKQKTSSATSIESG